MERIDDGDVDATKFRAATLAYDRATARYEQLMRHRLMNPLTVIAGMADTLCRYDDLHPTRVRQLHEAILDQARVLVLVSTEPRASNQLEACVDPWPCHTPRTPAARLASGVR
ncbi:MAG: hypothetical protein JWM98_3316 [Thermoleophilia bacterium]|nr:hypothetical protein [Thermoleophilia bacterium]